jgi:hypothetical protein
LRPRRTITSASATCSTAGRRRGAGIEATKPRACVGQSDATGQRSQRGDLGVQMVAPSSIKAWLKAPQFRGGRIDSANDHNRRRPAVVSVAPRKAKSRL